MCIFVIHNTIAMLLRTNPPTSKSLMISLTAFVAGGTIWFTMPEYAAYAVGSMILGYLVLLSGTLFKGI